LKKIRGAKAFFRVSKEWIYKIERREGTLLLKILERRTYKRK